MHNATSQASAASTIVEHDAITQNNNTEDIAFFISVTIMINERLRILGNVICRGYCLNVSFMPFKMNWFKVNITHPAHIAVYINADDDIDAFKYFS